MGRSNTSSRLCEYFISGNRILHSHVTIYMSITKRLNKYYQTVVQKSCLKLHSYQDFSPISSPMFHIIKLLSYCQLVRNYYLSGISLIITSIPIGHWPIIYLILCLFVWLFIFSYWYERTFCILKKTIFCQMGQITPPFVIYLLMLFN